MTLSQRDGKEVRWTDKLTDRQMVEQRDGQRDRWTDKHTDRQTDSLAE